jgi:hypothetical protein
MTGNGSCGAVTGSGLAIGLAMGITPKKQLENRGLRRKGYTAMQQAVVNKYVERYNSILCKDVQRKTFGKAWDLSRPELSEEFVRTSGVFDIKQRTPDRAVCLTPDCTIALAAMWASQYILEELEKGTLMGQFRIL